MLRDLGSVAPPPTVLSSHVTDARFARQAALADRQGLLLRVPHATATMLELAPIWVRYEAGACQLLMCVRGSLYGTLRSMPLVADWR